MKGWSIISNCESTVELQSVKGEALSDVLEEFAYHYQIDPIPVVNKSTVIFEVCLKLFGRSRNVWKRKVV